MRHTRDYPNILRNRDLLFLWRLLTILCTVGLQDNADLDERRKFAEQRFATIKQFQSETTDDFIARNEREYRGFLSAGNELVRYIYLVMRKITE